MSWSKLMIFVSLIETAKKGNIFMISKKVFSLSVHSVHILKHARFNNQTISIKYQQYKQSSYKIILYTKALEQQQKKAKILFTQG